MQEIQGDAWSFADHFDAPNFVRLPDRDITILEAREYLAAAKISEHPFFKIAKGSRSALKLWACQECVITNFFSQTLFALMSMVKNVHLRV